MIFSEVCPVGVAAGAAALARAAAATGVAALPRIDALAPLTRRPGRLRAPLDLLPFLDLMIY